MRRCAWAEKVQQSAANLDSMTCAFHKNCCEFDAFDMNVRNCASELLMSSSRFRWHQPGYRQQSPVSKNQYPPIRTSTQAGLMLL